MRLFLAIELSEELKDELSKLARKLEKEAPEAKYLLGSEQHLTLQFLGDVSDEAVGEIENTVRRAASATAPFTLTLQECGIFPPHGAARIGWAGLNDPSGTLQQLKERLEESLFELGFEPESREFTPHVTIARIKSEKSGRTLRELLAKATLPPLHQNVTSIALIQSGLTPKGPEYSILAAFDLGGAPT